jgi:hypothetical protein
MKNSAKTAGLSGPAAGNAMPGRSKKLACAMLALSLLASGSAFAEDSCKSVLCMYGKLTGNSGGSACSGAEQAYFDILVKKHGKIKWSDTASQRGKFLNSCDGADPSYTKKINDKFGKLLG